MPLTNANYLGILAWAVLLGIALRHAKRRREGGLRLLSPTRFRTVVRWIISLAPFGIMGLVYTSVSTNGLEIFTEYGQLLLVLLCRHGSCVAFVTNPSFGVRVLPQEPLSAGAGAALKDSGVTAFFTRSSAANIPVNMELCQQAGP